MIQKENITIIYIQIRQKYHTFTNIMIFYNSQHLG